MIHFIQQEEYASYGIDWDGPAPSQEWGSLPDSVAEGITVPDILVPFSADTTVENLSAVIDPLGETVNHGIDLYQQALALV